MAPDPKARLRTIGYHKGTVTATKGLFEYIMGSTIDSWEQPILTPGVPGKRRRRRYGCRQRSLARGGKVLNLKLDNGETYQCRITGCDIDFIAWLVGKGTKVQEVYTPRGTIYAKQFASSISGS